MDRMVSRGRMADEDEFEVGSDPPALEAPPARRRGPWLGTTPWVLAAAALVVTGVVVAPDEGLSLDGYPPGTVGMLAVNAAAPPEEMWRAAVEGGWDNGYQSVTVVGTAVVVLAGEYATGRSLETGEERWRVPADITACTVQQELTCVEREGEAGASIIRIDPASGAEQRINVRYAVEAVGLGDDVVTLVRHDDRLELQRVDSAGEPRWVSMVDLTGAPLGDTDAGYAVYAQLAVVGDRVYLTMGSMGIAVDVETGATDDGTVFMHTTGYGNVRREGVDHAFALVDDDGRVRIEDLVVTPDDDPDGLDLRTDAQRLTVSSGGDVLWESESTDGELVFPIARVAGVLMTRTIQQSSATELEGRDLLTGEVMWSMAAATSVLAAADSTLLTAGAADALAGIDVHRGETLWTYGDAPPTALALQPDGLVLLLGDEIVRLTWDRSR